MLIHMKKSVYLFLIKLRNNYTVSLNNNCINAIFGILEKRYCHALDTWFACAQFSAVSGSGCDWTCPPRAARRWWRHTPGSGSRTPCARTTRPRTWRGRPQASVAASWTSTSLPVWYCQTKSLKNTRRNKLPPWPFTWNTTIKSCTSFALHCPCFETIHKMHNVVYHLYPLKPRSEMRWILDGLSSQGWLSWDYLFWNRPNNN